MKNEAARLKLNKAQSLLNLVEMDYKNSENRIAELKEDIEKLEVIINKNEVKDGFIRFRGLMFKSVNHEGKKSMVAVRKGSDSGKVFYNL
ncbi:MAG TPA: hypothetical protein VFC62_02330, partial [Atopostipes sp.]|nr:hypothetical protein [Atopostipes sp.]